MKTKLSKLLCYFFGHKYLDIALDHGFYECLRCKDGGFEPLKGEEFHLWFLQTKHRLTYPLKQFILRRKWQLEDWWRGQDDSVPV